MKTKSISSLIVGMLLIVHCTYCQAADNTYDYAKFNELINQSSDLYDSQDYQGSIKAAEEALQYIHPDSLSCYSTAYNCFSMAYWRLGYYAKALDYGKKALEYDRQIGDSANISLSLALLSAIFTHQKLFSEAEHYMRDAADMVPYGDTRMLAARYATLGEILSAENKNDEAYNYIRKAYSLDSAANRTPLAAIRLSQLGYTLYNMKSYRKAQILLARANDGLKAAGNNSSLCINMIVQAHNYMELNMKHAAEEVIVQCLHLCDSLKLRKNKLDALKLLAKIRQSPELYRQAIALNDSLYNEQLQNQIAEFEVKYAKAEADKAAAEERIKHEAEKKRMRIVIISLTSGLFLISLLVFYIFRVLKLKKKANKELSEKNELLSEQKDEIESQRDTIKAQSDELQASINYARRIQRSLLTPTKTITRIFPDHFLLYKPRNVVSGDYYWVGQFGVNKVCVVADCTGHGVPGGFLSVLGMSNLNHIVKQNVNPEIILNHLRDSIIMNLRQSNNTSNSPHDNDDPDSDINRNFDGMDAAVYVINEQQGTLSFAGAYNSLVLIRDNEINLLKGDRMPVGIYTRIAPFKSTTIDLQHGDCIYTYSDGFQDQFGFGTMNKFSAKRLHELLLEIHQRPMTEQKEILNRTYEQWRGPASNQTDDVVIMGVRV